MLYDVNNRHITINFQSSSMSKILFLINNLHYKKPKFQNLFSTEWNSREGAAHRADGIGCCVRRCGGGACCGNPVKQEPALPPRAILGAAIHCKILRRRHKGSVPSLGWCDARVCLVYHSPPPFARACGYWSCTGGDEADWCCADCRGCGTCADIKQPWFSYNVIPTPEKLVWTIWV